MDFILYGVENQTEIHYAMPVKNMLYDALDYTHQVEAKDRSHHHDTKTPSSGEFLTGFWKGDRLTPSVTVTLYFGPDEWDGPLSLLDMMDISNPKVRVCMNDYKVMLIAPTQMSDEEIKKFHFNLQQVMMFIKYSKG
jgi:hypothetical protein